MNLSFEVRFTRVITHSPFPTAKSPNPQSKPKHNKSSLVYCVGSLAMLSISLKFTRKKHWPSHRSAFLFLWARKNPQLLYTRITITIIIFYVWTPRLITLLPEANSQKARTKPNLLTSIPQRSERSGFYMHIHYAHTVFDMINCQEYIIAVSGLGPQRWQKTTKVQECFLPIQRTFIKILVFFFFLDKWENSKKKKNR